MPVVCTRYILCRFANQREHKYTSIRLSDTRVHRLAVVWPPSLGEGLEIIEENIPFLIQTIPHSLHITNSPSPSLIIPRPLLPPGRRICHFDSTFNPLQPPVPTVHKEAPDTLTNPTASLLTKNPCPFLSHNAIIAHPQRNCQNCQNCQNWQNRLRGIARLSPFPQAANAHPTRDLTPANHRTPDQLPVALGPPFNQQRSFLPPSAF